MDQILELLAVWCQELLGVPGHGVGDAIDVAPAAGGLDLRARDARRAMRSDISSLRRRSRPARAAPRPRLCAPEEVASIISMSSMPGMVWASSSGLEQLKGASDGWSFDVYA